MALVVANRNDLDSSALTRFRAHLATGLEAKPRWFLIPAILAYVVAFSIYSLLRYYSYHTQFFDLGINTYSMRRVLQGSEGLETLILPGSFGHINHFSPILVLPLGLYALLPIPETLLVLQATLLGFAAVPLFYLAKHVLGNHRQAYLIALTYLLYPPLHGVNRYDFHVEAFIPILGFVALLALVRRRYDLFVATSLLLLLTHEFASVILCFTGGALLFWDIVVRREPFSARGRSRYPLTLFLLGLAFVVLTEVLSRVLIPGGSSLVGWLRDAPAAGVPAAPIFSWDRVTSDILLKGGYWLLLLFPLLFTPLYGWRASIAAIPLLAVVLLDTHLATHSIYFQYSAFAIPPLFFGAILGIRYLSRRSERPWDPKLLTTRIFAATLVMSVFLSVLSPVSPGNDLRPPGFVGYDSVPTPHNVATSRLLSLVPRDSLVLTQDELFPQLSDRRQVVMSLYLGDPGPPDYVAVDLSASYFWYPPKVEYGPALSHQLPALFSNHTYGLVGFSDTTLVYGPEGSALGYAVEDPMMPASPVDFTNWSGLGGHKSYGPGVMGLGPGADGYGYLWTGFARPRQSLLFDFSLTFRNPGSPTASSGLLLQFTDPAHYQAVYFVPASGQVRYARVTPSDVTDILVGNFTPSSLGVVARILWSGGTIQTWVDGALAGFTYGAADIPTSTVGFITFQQDLSITDFAIHESTAANPPWGPLLPPPAVEAMLALIIPATLVVAFPGPFLRLTGRAAALVRLRPRNQKSG